MSNANFHNFLEKIIYVWINRWQRSALTLEMLDAFLKKNLAEFENMGKSRESSLSAIISQLSLYIF
jgi:hypothetical protein